MQMPKLADVRSADLRQVTTFLLNREGLPAALVGATGHVIGVSSAFEHLVGFGASDLVGKRWTDVLAKGSDREIVRAKMRTLGKELQIRLPMTTRAGRRVDLTADVHVIGAGPRRAFFVAITSWSAADREHTPLEVSDIVYEVGITDFGRVKFVRSDQIPDSKALVSKRCHDVIYGRSEICKGCPALTILKGATESIDIVRSRDGAALIADARRVDVDTIRLNVRPAPPELVKKLLDARIEDLARGGQLTERETEVVRLMVLGCSAHEVSRALQISLSTAKFHQTNVLRKLGVDSRLGLLRLLL
jgi:PAS domain S-box-containing protein